MIIYRHLLKNKKILLMEVVGKKIKVHGRVQGVGFRQFTVYTAQEYNIQGTVKNLFDGSVECYAKGTKENMEKFIQKLRKGPPSAKVTNIEIEDISPTLIPNGFKIIY
ncbi:MAG: acylphosphatase [Leptonema sp. (in: bacteria)]|jgi:acylphosphatase